MKPDVRIGGPASKSIPKTDVTRYNKAVYACDPKDTTATEPRRMNGPKKRRARYPRFTRENGHLVRIGWSKWRSREYEIRRVPKYAVEALVSRILDVADVDGNFVRPYLRALSDVEHGDIPEEAARLALLWLVSTGLVKKFRGSYQVGSDDDLLNGWEKSWTRLPLSRRGTSCVV